MGYKNFQNLLRIKEIIRDSNTLTNGFKDFNKDKLAKYPTLLLVIRLAAGMSQREFSRTTNISRSALAHYELGIKKRIRAKRAEKISESLNKMIGEADFSETKIIENFEKMWHQAEFGQDPDKLREHGRKAIKSRKPTYDEEKIAEILEKEIRTKYEREGVLRFMKIPFAFDFLIPNSKKPLLAIECKTIQSTSKRSFRIISYRIAYEIGYKFRLLKEKFPNIKTILILESELEKLPERVVKIFEKETDVFLFNETHEKIINSLLKMHPKSG
jgi:transcriptional regulator with XRE-family HTH domain